MEHPRPLTGEKQVTDVSKLYELEARCDEIARQAMHEAISGTACDTVEQLERFHDRLACQVRDLAEVFADFLSRASAPTDKGGR
jgi:hypothetical protein